MDEKKIDTKEQTDWTVRYMAPSWYQSLCGVISPVLAVLAAGGPLPTYTSEQHKVGDGWNLLSAQWVGGKWIVWIMQKTLLMQKTRKPAGDQIF